MVFGLFQHHFTKNSQLISAHDHQYANMHKFLYEVYVSKPIMKYQSRMLLNSSGVLEFYTRDRGLYLSNDSIPYMTSKYHRHKQNGLYYVTDQVDSIMRIENQYKQYVDIERVPNDQKWLYTSFDPVDLLGPCNMTWEEIRNKY